MPKVTCDCEKYSVVVDCDTLEWNYNVNPKHSDGMGNEIEHYATYEECCPKCGEEFSVTFSCWEYPTGVVETTEVDPDGCTVDGSCCPNLSEQDCEEE